MLSSMVTASGGVGRKPRVLIACSGVGHVFRGFEAASEELAGVLRHSANVMLARGGGPWLGRRGLRLPCVQRFGASARCVGLSGPSGYLLEQRSFAPSVYALARLGRFDVVHLHDPGLMNAVWHARRCLGGRFAIAFTNGGPIGPEHLGRPDLIQSVTPVDGTRLREAGFPDWRVAVVPHGIRHTVSINRTFVDGPPKALIGVGTLNDSHKGFATAIRAAAEIPQVTLRLLGQRDGETPDIEKLGHQLLGSRFSTGTVPQDQVPIALTSAEAFVLPTHHEGFCIAILEAMSAGLPCLVSDIPVLRWLVQDAAVLLPPDRPERWAAALRDLTAQRRRDLSERGRRRAADFHWDRLLGDYVSMYEKALAAREKIQAS
jgi:glycosyltransferase involved in cell wall biosynthesis